MAAAEAVGREEQLVIEDGVETSFPSPRGFVAEHSLHLGEAVQEPAEGAVLVVAVRLPHLPRARSPWALGPPLM